MLESPSIESSKATPPRRPTATLALFAAAIALVAVVFFHFTSSERRRAASASGQQLSFGAAEKAYASNIRVENIALNRAENFIHQEVTTLSGEAVNGGGRSLAGLVVAVEFFDEANQIAMRETHAIIELGAPALPPGEHRSFEFSFEHIPDSWNRQQPVVRVTGLHLLP